MDVRHGEFDACCIAKIRSDVLAARKGVCASNRTTRLQINPVIDAATTRSDQVDQDWKRSLIVGTNERIRKMTGKGRWARELQ